MTDETADDTRPAAVVLATRIRVSDHSVRVGAPAALRAHGEPKIQLVREDGVVRAIDVTCGCGETVRIRCDYS